MQTTFTTASLYRILKYNLLLLILLVLLIATAIYSTVYFFIPVSFEANTQLLLSESNGVQETYSKAQEMAANLQLIQTYNDLIKSNVILSAVIEAMALDVTIKQLSKNVTIHNERNSFVVTISVKALDKNEAIGIADTIASVVKRELPMIVGINDIKILSSAVLLNDDHPIWKEPLPLALLSTILGVIIAITLLIYKEMRNGKIYSIEQLRQLTPNVLGVLSRKKQRAY